MTNKKLQALLPGFLEQLTKKQSQRPHLILAVWPEMIGDKLAPMTQAVLFDKGVLHIKVKNSTLLSLLVQHERPRLLAALRRKFPSVEIHNITFRLG
ncbi:MAG: DUF721 domain-containing protein [Verrucomicrobia bacterium]|nr:DUF721 domain-containing protein [Verrucomicrobiota bacterium]